MRNKKPHDYIINMALSSLIKPECYKVVIQEAIEQNLSVLGYIADIINKKYQPEE